MKKAIKVGFTALALTSTAMADQFNLFSSVKPYFELRPRYEFVEDKNNTLKDAHALTNKTVIGLHLNQILGVKDLNGYIEATNVVAIIDKYSPEEPGYDAVPDPNNTRITQAYISYTLNKTTFIAGRKFVVIDDHRFIGNVIWRQMPQSFGVIAVSDKTLPDTNIMIAGIYERLGIVDSLNTKWDIDKMPLVFDINYRFRDDLNIKGFAYLLTDLHNTYGLKLSGKRKYNNFSVSYLTEYAKQTDPYKKDKLTEKPDIDTDYWRIGVDTNVKRFIFGAEYTHFGDKNGKDKGFSTPLATLHKFEGWSDILLTGSAKGYDYGLDEYKFTVGVNDKTYGKFLLSYLVFNSYKTAPNGDTVGQEFDLLYMKKLYKNLSFLAKSAFYRGEDGYYSQGKLLGTKDATKFWIQVSYKY